MENLRLVSGFRRMGKVVVRFRTGVCAFRFCLGCTAETAKTGFRQFWQFVATGPLDFQREG